VQNENGKADKNDTISLKISTLHKKHRKYKRRDNDVCAAE